MKFLSIGRHFCTLASTTFLIGSMKGILSRRYLHAFFLQIWEENTSLRHVKTWHQVIGPGRFEEIWFLQNVGIRLSSDAATYSRRTHSQLRRGENLTRLTVEFMASFLQIILIYCECICGSGEFGRYRESARDGRSADRIPVGTRFFTPVQAGSGAYPALFAGSISPVWSGQGVAPAIHPI